jgi:1-deoxy-D-xylulose-5-phosphate synthase
MSITTTVVDARFAKPIDTQLIEHLASNHRMLLTIEESIIGGFATQVADFLLNKGFLDRGTLKFRSLHLPDIFVEQNHDRSDMLRDVCLDANSIIKLVKEVVI